MTARPLPSRDTARRASRLRRMPKLADDPVADLQGRIAASLKGCGLPRVGWDAERERARIYGLWMLEQVESLRAELGSDVAGQPRVSRP